MTNYIMESVFNTSLQSIIGFILFARNCINPIQVRKLIGNSDDEESAHMPQSGEEDGDGEPKVMARFLVDETQRKWTDDCAADAGQGSIWV